MSTNVTGVIRNLSVRSFGARRLTGNANTRFSFGRITPKQNESVTHTVVRKRNASISAGN